MASDKVRFGIIGCGMIAEFHCTGIAKCPEAQLHAVCDPIPERADTFAAKLGDRVKLGHPVTAIEHGATGVRVTVRNAGEGTLDFTIDDPSGTTPWLTAASRSGRLGAGAGNWCISAILARIRAAATSAAAYRGIGSAVVRKVAA